MCALPVSGLFNARRHKGRAVDSFRLYIFASKPITKSFGTTVLFLSIHFLMLLSDATSDDVIVINKTRDLCVDYEISNFR